MCVHLFFTSFPAARRLPVLLLCLLPVASWSHGVVGKRFFPSTLAIEDPFANDELSLVGSHIREPGEGDKPSTRATSLEAEYARTLTPNVALSIGNEYLYADPDTGKTRRGFGNLELGVKYQFYTHAATETVASASLGISLNHTGDTHLEANDFTTLSPAILFGQGFGALPDSAGLLRPLAITGVLDFGFPSDSRSRKNGEAQRNPVTSGWGMALMYNLHYLQTSVRDVGLKAPFNRMVPIVEVAGETCLNRGCNGDTTAFINPGVIWIGKTFQLGAEAQIPINHRTGDSTGVLLQLHLFLDDLFPRTIPMTTGHPGASPR